MWTVKYCPDWIAASSSVLAFLLYTNTFQAGFVYDDNRAILSNEDVLPESPWTSLWMNDFWGTALSHSGSHKSFRPLTTLSFRINCYFSRFNPWSYHVTNVVLHSITTWLFVRVARILLRITTPYANHDKNKRLALIAASFLFASHPIHTEAVAGVVGRADVGSTSLALAAFLCYVNHIKLRDKCITDGRKNQSSSNHEITWSKCHPGWLQWCKLLYLACAVFLAAGSLFFKEQGITILLVCALYDILRSLARARRNQEQVRLYKLECRSSVLLLAGMFITLSHLRLSLMGGFVPPKFAKADNPTAHHPNFYTRSATFFFLPLFNLYLFLFPVRLSYDWSMEAIPRIESIYDWRNLLWVGFYAFLAHQVVKILKQLLQVPATSETYHDKMCCSKQMCCTSGGSTKSLRNNNNNNNNYCNNSNCCVAGDKNVTSRLKLGGHKVHVSSSGRAGGTKGAKGFKRQWNGSPARFSPEPEKSCGKDGVELLMQLAFLILPFLPATNLFFYVGFVVAERVLYMPSVGFCLLAGHGLGKLAEKADRRGRNVLLAGAFITLLCLSARTLRRNQDWRDEEELYSSGIATNPPKSWGNLGNILNSQGRTTEAEVAYRQALRFRPNMADVHYNLGLVLEGQGRLDEALSSYRSAIHFRPLLACAYVNAGGVLSRTEKTKDAMELYRKCYHLPDDGIKDLRSHIDAKVSALLRHGRLLVEHGDDPKSAIILYRKAIQLMPPNFSQAQSIYNAIGEALSRTGEASEAEEWFKKALEMQPDHVPAHLTYGKMLARNKTRLVEAEAWFRRAKKIAPGDYTVYQHYGQFLASQGRHPEAAESYIIAHDLTPTDYDVVVGAANCLRQAGDNQMAEIYYEKAVLLRPQEARAHMNLGAILHLNKKYAQAEQRYLKALQLNPQDYMTKENLKKLCQLQSSKKFMLYSCSPF